MVGFDPKEKVLHHGDHIIAGASSGIFTRFFTQPLDVLKIRFQLQVEPICRNSNTSKYRGLCHSIQTIVREEGWTALWKGHAGAQVLTATYMAAEFAAFEALTKTFALHLDSQRRTSIHFISGAGAGGFATFVSYPLDVMRTRFVAQGNSRLYYSIYHAVSHIYTNEGVMGFYKGLWASIVHGVPQAALHFGCYESYKQAVRPILVVSGRDQNSLNAMCGVAAGVTSKLLVYPFDTGKRRLQVIGFHGGRAEFGVTNYYRGLVHYLILGLKEEGIRGFYKGVSWALLKSGVSTGMYFYFYEHMCRAIRLYKESASDIE